MATATPPTAQNSLTNVGDDTLLGTRLEVLAQLQNGKVVNKFQITSAVGLDQDQALALAAHFEAGRVEEAVALLKSTSGAGADRKFGPMLDAAAAPELNPPTGFAGRGGFPNLRLIGDFRLTPPTRTFQVHTILDIDSADSAQQLQTALSAGNASSVVDLVKEHCDILDETSLMAMLTAALPVS